MAEWNRGYFAKNGYAFGFYPETMPNHLQWACSLQSHQAKSQNFRYLDAGCGQGLNLIIAAACHPDSEFVGVDFLPEHIAHAQRLAMDAGLKNVSFMEGDFVALSHNPAVLGEFDYAVCHGIATWVSPIVRESLFRLIGSVLKPGGVFYNSYNTQPGWLSMLPFQNLVKLHLKDTPPAQAISQSKAFFEELMKSVPGVLNYLPELRERLASLDGQEIAYLFQEYNHEHWQPLFVSDMIEAMEQQKLDYLGTSTLAEIDEAFFPDPLKACFADAKSPVVREQIKDYVTKKSFRRDLYVKGRLPAWKLEHEEQLMGFRVIRNPTQSLPDQNADFRFTAGAVSFQGNRHFYMSLLDAASSHEKGIEVRELIETQMTAERRQHVVSAVNLLIGAGYLHVMSDTNSNFSDAKRLNAVLCQSATQGAPYKFISLPACGHALVMQDIEWLALALQGRDQSVPLAEQIFAHLQRLGRAVAENGVPVTDKVKAINIINATIKDFQKVKYPFLKANLAI